MGREIEHFNFREALRVAMDISGAGNALLQFNEPWRAFKDDPDTVRVVLNLGLQYVAALSVALRPFLPFTAARLRELLALRPLDDRGDLLALLNDFVDGHATLPPHHALNQAEHLFSRIPDEAIQREIDKLVSNDPEAAQPAPGESRDETAAAVPEYKPLGETIAYDDFARLDIRTGTILEAEAMPKSKKLLRLRVDLGFEQRTILSGIAEHFKPEEVVGRQVVVLANLAPRVMMGTESQGMILMAEDAAGKLSFVAPDGGWPNGWGVK